MKTEVHVYAFSVAANVLLSFFPFLIVMMSLSRLVFNEYTTIASVDLAMKDFFPDALGTFLQNNLPQRGPTQIMSLCCCCLRRTEFSSRSKWGSTTFGGSGKTGVLCVIIWSAWR